MNDNKLTRQQKEAVALLSIGTFLEYFDLMLYIHMGVLLNELFLPQTNPIIARFMGITIASMTFVIRPIGGIVIGRIGDVLGRKATIFITTSIMALCCLTVYILPTYAEIGITASIIILICRMLQGFSSLGECIGAKLYLTEILKPPHRSIFVGIIVAFVEFGGFLALLVALFTINIGLNWRYAFLVGTVIAIIGLLARTRLRETVDFVDYKRKMKNKKINCLDSIVNEKADKKTIVVFFFAEIIFAVPFCVTFIYMSDFMRNNLGYSMEEIMIQNLKISFFAIISVITASWLTKKFHPLKIVLTVTIFFTLLLPFLPYLLNNIVNMGYLSLFQCAIYILVIPTYVLLEPVFFKHFPVGQRFSYIATTFGISGALTYGVALFSLISLTYYIGNYALWVLFIPTVFIILYAYKHLKTLEIKSGRYHNYPHEDPPHEDTAINEEDYDYEDLGDEYEPFTNKCEYSKNLMNKLNEFSKEKNAKLNMKLIDKAITFAKKWHGTQMRKTGDHPFYWHPLKVAEMVAERYCKTDMVIGAILHDTVEDSECTVELIEEKFNARIAEMVDRLTNKRFENGENIKLNFEETINRLQNVGDTETLFIKQMDRQHNLETIEGLKPHKQRKMAEETNDYFIRLIAIIGDKLNIHGKMRLENKMFKSCNAILKKKKR